MGQAAQSFRVLFLEEPEFAPLAPHFRMRIVPSGVLVLTPVFDRGCDRNVEQCELVRALVRGFGNGPQVHWFYTPMAMQFARDLDCDLRVYDCMDELAAFRFAPAELYDLEDELLSRSDLVFAGGESLFVAKAGRHPHVHCFPSSVDVRHFRSARNALADPPDQATIPYPRIGYFGVIDERMDLALVAQMAEQLADVHFVMMGPTAKIEVQDLPQAPNLHWIGRREYSDLPAYMANWQSGWMPFALNEHTRLISPTKTPEFLAAGLPVTSTAVPDVVSHYGREGLVAIADSVCMAEALRRSLQPAEPSWLLQVDRHLADMSWADTWTAMHQLMPTRARIAERV
jgi:glycosyltransferase involved in cell wall biosynthesis